MYSINCKPPPRARCRRYFNCPANHAHLASIVNPPDARAVRGRMPRTNARADNLNICSGNARNTRGCGGESGGRPAQRQADRSGRDHRRRPAHRPQHGAARRLGEEPFSADLKSPVHIQRAVAAADLPSPPLAEASDRRIVQRHLRIHSEQFPIRMAKTQTKLRFLAGHHADIKAAGRGERGEAEHRVAADAFGRSDGRVPFEVHQAIVNRTVRESLAPPAANRRQARIRLQFRRPRAGQDGRTSQSPSTNWTYFTCGAISVSRSTPAFLARAALKGRRRRG